VPWAYEDEGAYKGKNIIEKRPTTEISEEKGAYEGQNERNKLSKKILLRKYQKSA
jgi:hypothetical protein